MDILHEYFLVPLMRNGWFNPVNSLVYGIGLMVGIWAVFNLLKKVNVDIDRGLFISVIPFIAFAGVTRTLRDYVYFSASSQAGFLDSFSGYIGAMQESAYEYILGVTGIPALAWIDSYIIAWFPTPGSYMITFMLALLALFIGLVVRKYRGIECWKTMFLMGSIFFLVNASLLKMNSLVPLLYVGSVTLMWTIIFFGLSAKRVQEKVKMLGKHVSDFVERIFTPTNSAILSAHFFDATATFFAIAMFSTMGGHGYTEQHFLSRGLMPFLGPQVMFLLKFIVVVPVLYYIDKYADDKKLSNFLKLAIFILGAAPATRNLVRLIVGV